MYQGVCGAHDVASDAIHICGVMLTLEWSLGKHIIVVSVECYFQFQLQQLHHTWRSRDSDPATTLTTLVYAFVASRVDYYRSLSIGATKKTTDKLQHALNATARIVSNSSKYDWGPSNFWRDKLHWLDINDWIWFSLCPGVQMSA